MINEFKYPVIRDSGIIYNSTFEQIRQLYEVDPEMAGELAISAIELVLTGGVSSDNMMVGVMLEPMKKIGERNAARYEAKVESTKQKKIREMRLQEIADLVIAGRKQREIGEILGLSQQNVSYRVNLIRTQYPELLAIDDLEESSTNENTNTSTQFTNDTNKFTNKNAVVCKNEDGAEEEEEPVVYQKGFKF